MWPFLMGTEGPELSLIELMPSMLVAVYCGLMSAIIVCMTYFKLNRSKKLFNMVISTVFTAICRLHMMASLDYGVYDIIATPASNCKLQMQPLQYTTRTNVSVLYKSFLALSTVTYQLHSRITAAY